MAIATEKGPREGVPFLISYIGQKMLGFVDERKQGININEDEFWGRGR